jgi:hypothetical protein
VQQGIYVDRTDKESFVSKQEILEYNSHQLHSLEGAINDIRDLKTLDRWLSSADTLKQVKLRW